MTVKLIVIDLDATLLRNDKTYDQEAFQEAAEKLMDQGVIMCIATGNVEHRLVSYFDDHIIERLYLAADNGNYLSQNNQMIHAFSVPKEDVDKVLEYSSDREGIKTAISTGEMPYVLKSQLTPEVEDLFHIYFDYMERLDSFDQIPENLPVTKIAMHTDYGLEANKKIVRGLIELLDESTAVTSGGGWFDVYHQDGGKGSAVEYLQEKYDVSPAETLCFGDSLNDASMMKKADLTVALSNADPDLKEMCDYEIGSNEEQAVTCILQQLAENNSISILDEHKK